MTDRVVVLLTALNLEYEAVRARLTGLRVHWHPAGTRFEIGRVKVDHADQVDQAGCRVALGLVGKGNHPAAVLAERAMSEFSPTAVLFVGVAGGLWPSIRLGDVVVASQVYAYHGGTSEDDGLKARPRVWEIPHGAAQVSQYLARTGQWARGLAGDRPPKVHFGPIAAGEVVQDSAVSDQARWVRQHYHDALAIEMEGAGVAQAGHLRRALPVVVVRGISDRADGTKHTTDGENWQPRAAANAAAFAAALALELVSDGGCDRPTDLDQKGSSQMELTNFAGGNARVAVQAGQIYGNVSVGPPAAQPPTDLAAELAELRGLLEHASRAGRLDQDTYQAAAAELETASGCLKEDTTGSRSALAVALKRLRGLVADVAEIAAKLSMLITAVRERS